MNSIENYFCWVRVLSATAAARLHPQVQASRQLALELQAIRLDFLAGPRPPRVTAAPPAPDGTDGSDGNAAASPVGYWFADEDFCGDPTAGTIVDYGPAFLARDTAVAWISGPEGRAWAAEALNYFLFCFEREHVGASADSLKQKASPRAHATTGAP